MKIRLLLEKENYRAPSIKSNVMLDRSKPFTHAVMKFSCIYKKKKNLYRKRISVHILYIFIDKLDLTLSKYIQRWIN